MKAANLFALFVGLETPDPVARVEAHKLQDTRRDITESIHKIHRAGLFVNPGFINRLRRRARQGGGGDDRGGWS